MAFELPQPKWKSSHKLDQISVKNGRLQLVGKAAPSLGGCWELGWLDQTQELKGLCENAVYVFIL